VSRLQEAEPRRLFRHTVVERELARSSPLPTVRAVSIGCGKLLTDFEVLLELSSRGCIIETFVAIDPGYALFSSAHGECMESLAALARFFVPHCRVFSFSSTSAYIAAATSQPERYGRATMFMRCDAREVEDVQYQDAAATALLPGCCSFELWNSDKQMGSDRPPLERYLPQRLRTELEYIYGRKRWSLGVLRRRASSAAKAAAGDGTLVAGGGTGATSKPMRAGFVARRCSRKCPTQACQVGRLHTASASSRRQSHISRAAHDGAPPRIVSASSRWSL
jgi:hypothetical protein